MSKIGDFFKKRLGTAANRDPRVTWGGTFGTEGSRKKQKERLADKEKYIFPKSTSKFTDSVGGKLKSSDSEVKVPLRQKAAEGASATTKAAPQAAPKAAPKPAAAKPKAATPKVDRMKDFMTGFEGNAVARRINERAATMNEVARAKSGDDALERIRQRAQSLAKSRSAEDDKRRAEKVDMAKNYKKGGKVDGIAQRGKTKGRYI